MFPDSGSWSVSSPTITGISCIAKIPKHCTNVWRYTNHTCTGPTFTVPTFNLTFRMFRGGAPGYAPPPPPLWRRIYYMTLSFYCKKGLISCVQTHQKVSKEQKYSKNPPTASLLHHAYQISHIYLKEKKSGIPLPLLKISVSSADVVYITGTFWMKYGGFECGYGLNLHLPCESEQYHHLQGIPVHNLETFFIVT